MYFNPLNYKKQWHIISGEQLEDGDWELFGLIYVYEWEWGYIKLSELKAIQLPLLHHIQREKTIFDMPIQEVLKQHGVDGYKEYLNDD